MAECTELGVLINDMAMNLASRGKVRTLEGVLKELKQVVPDLDRNTLAEAIVLANRRDKTTLSIAAQLRAAIKGEARTNVGLVKAIEDLEGHIAAGTTPVPTPRVERGTVEIKKMRKVRDELKKEIRRRDVEAREVKKLEAQVARLNQHIKEGTFPVKTKRKPRPVSARVQKLRTERDRLNKRLRELRPKKDPELRQIASLDEQIKGLEKHLAAGTLPKTGPRTRKAVSDRLAERRARRDELKKQIRESPAAIKERLQAQIDRLEQKIKEGVKPPQRRTQEFPTKELERLAFQRDELRREVNRIIIEMRPKGIFETVVDPFNAARSIMASMDFSAVLRQGAFVALGNPGRAIKSMPVMFKSFLSKRTSERVNRELFERANAPLYARYKLHISPIDDPAAALGKREEVYMSRILDRLASTRIGKVALFPIKGSERAYVTFLNKLRADSFDAMANGLARNGKLTQKEGEALANFINNATGRGSLGKYEAGAAGLNTFFFAPRYAISRFNMVTGMPLVSGFKASGRVGRAITLEYAKFLAAVGTLYTISDFAGAELNFDPRSSDFGKIKVGNTRIDPLGGMSQMTVILGRHATRETVSTITGMVNPLTGDIPYGKADLFEATGKFLRAKFSPLLATYFDLQTGKNVIGQPVTWQDAALGMVTPLSFREIGEAIEEQGVPAGTALGLLAIFGAGLQTYGGLTTK